jgi:RHS repeat-associated protein
MRIRFGQAASNLVADDTNDAMDIFVHGALEATTTYAYDDADRLTGVCFDVACAAVLTYTYDPVGNRLTQLAPGGTTSYAHDAADQLTSITDPAGSATTYTYDDAGRQTAAGSDSFAYDAADRLTDAIVGGVEHSYTYAGDGRRLSATDDGVTTDFIWDQNFALPQLVTETNSSGASLRSYTYGLGLTPLSLTADSATRYLSTDALGSVLATSDAAGAVQTTTSYQPFGAILTTSQVSGTGSDNPMAFTGQYLDPTGLYHLRARQYDPGTGRFLTTDPLATAVGDPFVASYVYGRNGPTILTDPRGLAAVRIAEDGVSVLSHAADSLAALRGRVSEAARVLRQGGPEASGAGAALRQLSRLTKNLGPWIGTASRALLGVGAGLDFLSELNAGASTAQAGAHAALTTGGALGGAAAAAAACTLTPATVFGGAVCGAGAVVIPFVGGNVGSYIADNLPNLFRSGSTSF